MIRKNKLAIAATRVATIVAFLALVAALASCKGRKMDNMEPSGDTVEVVIVTPDDAEPAAPADSI